LPHTYLGAEELPPSFTWANVGGVSYLTHSLNQHIPQVSFAALSLLLLLLLLLLIVTDCEFVHHQKKFTIFWFVDIRSHTYTHTSI